MLTAIEIRDLALLASAKVALRPGLVALTGATGVGKSLVLEALGLLAGARASAESVRTGADAAVVRGLFQLSPERAAAVAAVLGIDPPGDGEILLERRVDRNGRGGATANGSAVRVASLREASPLLVEIHGQSEHQRLLDPREQALLLDRSGDGEGERAAWEAALRAAREARRKRGDLAARRRERRARLDYLDHVAAGIGEASLRPGERAALEEERARFDGAERFLADLHGAVEALMEGEGSAADRLGEARAALQRAAALDGRLRSALDAVEEARERASDAAREAAGHLEDAVFDPGRRAAVEDRIEALDRVLRVHGPSEEEALAAVGAAEEEAAALREEEEDGEAAAGREADAVRALGAAAAALVKRRRAAAKALARGVLGELADLALGAARFEAAVDAGEGDLVETGTEAGPGPVAFLFTANPGEPLLPLSRVASGGELARVSLALKARLAAADRTPTLVFDEVDAEIGGRLGPAVAAKLRRVAAGRQVLVVTHLPSIAAAADLHLRVTKRVEKGRTVAEVEPLEGPERERELAAMLRGEEKVDQGLETARALLAETSPPAAVASRRRPR